MKKVAWLVMVMLLLGACGTDEPASSGAGTMPEEVKVSFNTEQTAEAIQPVVLSVTVTQGEEAVEDADEVVFEVWQSGHREHSEMITAEHTEKGIYEAVTEFDEDGLYFVQAHTTARRLHAMPKQEITVGSPDPASIIPDDSDDSQGMDKMNEHMGH
ncbi:FixH family protein [Planococcus sp. YIM B11945]|uniref:FixH family protein n=1 Tax=Planococcus sp. YIM B11945 TaxID=3435410 RepID=UPI003D7CFCD6